MKVSEAIDIAETWLDYASQVSNNDELIEAIDTLINSGIHKLALEMRVEDLEAELNRYLTRSVYNNET